MDDRIFYGPFKCRRCEQVICKASQQQGGEEFQYPEGPIYPNTQWVRHNCPPQQTTSIPTGAKD